MRLQYRLKNLDIVVSGAPAPDKLGVFTQGLWIQGMKLIQALSSIALVVCEILPYCEE